MIVRNEDLGCHQFPRKINSEKLTDTSHIGKREEKQTAVEDWFVSLLKRQSS